MKNEVETTAGRVIYIRAPKRLTPAQLTMALQGMAEDDPRWLAVHQLIDEELAAAVLDSSSANLPDNQVRHAGGRVDALSTLKQRLMTERKKSVETGKGVKR